MERFAKSNDGKKSWEENKTKANKKLNTHNKFEIKVK